jgi:hypothetical protein
MFRSIAWHRFLLAAFLATLLALQWREARSTYFSMYASRQWAWLGYPLYLILLFFAAAYGWLLARSHQYLMAVLQAVCFAVLLGIMLSPFTSRDHLALIPYIFVLQPIVFLCDRAGRLPDEESRIEEAAWGAAVYILISPVLIGLAIFSPLFEKALIAANAVVGHLLVARKLGESRG